VAESSSTERAMRELPTGTVTFLFTDVEGSTRLERQLRDRYGEAITQHRKLLRDAFELAGGREIDTQGDAFFVVFPTAMDAVTAAVEAQRLVAAHAWPDGSKVRVRIGIHTGEASIDEERYLGLAVHRAARICAAGHGGQVLLSSTTRDLVEDDLPRETGVVDLGEHRLKDIPRPERIYQLVVNGLPDEFPPLKTLDTEPIAALPFGGREGELAEAVRKEVALPKRRRPARLFLLIGLGLPLTAAIALAAVLLTRADGGITVPPNAVGVIDPSSMEVVAQVPVGNAPGPIAVGEGAVWVANEQDRTLSRIDPRARRVVKTIPLEARPTGVAVGAGAVWVAHGLTGEVSRVEPDLNEAQKIEVLAAPPLGGWKMGAVAVGFGSVWFVWGDSIVSRIEPGTNRVVSPAAYAGSGPVAISTGEGAVWVLNRGENTVFRINPRTNGIDRTITVSGRPAGIAVGADAVWVTDSEGHLLARISPLENSAATTPVPGKGPEGVAVGFGRVWVAESGSSSVSAIDPVTREVEATVRVGNRPQGITAGEGAVWTSVRPP
jgi:YVTN family beta-propeller protein